MSTAPFMQLYVADYIGDTLHLTTEQHGAYLLLLMAMWRTGGTLPNEEHKLARIVGLSPARWRRVGGDVLAFFDVTDEQITQKRLMKEIEKVKEKSAKRAEAGAKGGAAKALKDKETAVATATVLPQHSSDIRDQTLEREEDKNKNSSPPALRPDEKEAGGRAFENGFEEVPDGFDEAASLLRRAWQERGLDPPDMSRVAVWLEQGHSVATIVAVVRERLAAGGSKARGLSYFDRSLLDAKPQRDAKPLKDALPTIYVRQLDPAWPTYAEAYRTAKGKDPPTDRAGGWHFPIDLLPAHSTH
jgi:uncharacterized protein YdaU (DUF1376 family)